jgi:hypothetical protein
MALAGLGRLDEAKVAPAPLHGAPDVPEWMYWWRMSTVWGVAGEDRQALDCHERAIACSPDSAELMIGLAQDCLEPFLRARNEAHPIASRRRWAPEWPGRSRSGKAPDRVTRRFTSSRR